MVSLGWLAGFALFGAAAMEGFMRVMFPHVLAGAAHEKLIGLGAAFGLNLFMLAMCFALLPGARRPPGETPPFGLAQGIWGMAGFGLAMTGGGALLANVLTVENLTLIARHESARVDFGGQTFLMATVLAGESMAALWVVWYLRRLGAVRMRDGGESGIGWCAAPALGYVSAAVMAVWIVCGVGLLFFFFPPDMRALQALPDAKLFEGSGLAMVPLLAVAVFIGPVLEEIVFRGIAFAGLAARLGPVWAGVVTTVAFMAAHAPEKIYYLPGFIDVGLMAACAVVLRLKFRSIRPAIALHVMYNIGSMVAAALFVR
jgi:membrane protease YdiL (CAAX protease family)